MPAIRPAEPGTARRIAARVFSAAAHQCAGSCSAQPGRGTDSGYSSVAEAATTPALSTRIDLHPEVPMSIPITRSFMSVSYV